MPDYKQVRHERLYVKEPGTERLRKNSAGRLKHLLAFHHLTICKSPCFGILEPKDAIPFGILGHGLRG